MRPQLLVLLALCVMPFAACAVPNPAPAPAPPKIVPAKHAASASFDQTHALWTAALAQYVHVDNVDYKHWKLDRAGLDSYLHTLESVKPEEFAAWTREQKFAFWINAYNAYVVGRILEAYPVDSIQDLSFGKAPIWDQETIALGKLAPELKKDKLCFDDIENKILRPVFKDARVHAALNCATQSAPPPQNCAYEASKLSEQLDAQARRWLADGLQNIFDVPNNRMSISNLFDWFKEDFVRDAGSVREWIIRYSSDEIAAWLRRSKNVSVEPAKYSWIINFDRPTAAK
jgi:hypothetical protein